MIKSLKPGNYSPNSNFPRPSLKFPKSKKGKRKKERKIGSESFAGSRGAIERPFGAIGEAEECGSARAAE